PPPGCPAWRPPGRAPRPPRPRHSPLRPRHSPPRDRRWRPRSGTHRWDRAGRVGPSRRAPPLAGSPAGRRASLADGEGHQGVLVALLDLARRVDHLQLPRPADAHRLGHRARVVLGEQAGPDVGDLLGAAAGGVVDLEADVARLLEGAALLEGGGDEHDRRDVAWDPRELDGDGLVVAVAVAGLVVAAVLQG